ncbi:unnamed protein product [Pleuronectes platessa]|uniref:Uncharacterized protein n=1 Tax=Pleuronectes platessa TaxID=8262 RepID=A0A9N7UMS6_PLEPL|nr:unnamed protein product [Pleuronectes platessa]
MSYVHSVVVVTREKTRIKGSPRIPGCLNFTQRCENQQETQLSSPIGHSGPHYLWGLPGPYKARSPPLLAQEEWTNISVSRCAKLVETYPKRHAALIAAKEGSPRY